MRYVRHNTNAMPVYIQRPFLVHEIPYNQWAQNESKIIQAGHSTYWIELYEFNVLKDKIVHKFKLFIKNETDCKNMKTTRREIDDWTYCDMQ